MKSKWSPSVVNVTLFFIYIDDLNVVFKQVAWPYQSAPEVLGKEVVANHSWQTAFAFRYSCKVIFHFLSFVLLMTALIVTGPLLPRPAKTLPPELESFMTNSGDDGVVVVAFGSMVSTLPTQTLRMLAIVLGRMKQKVLWKIKGISIFSFRKWN